MKIYKLNIILIFTFLIFFSCKEENKIVSENKDTVINKTSEQETLKNDSTITKSTPDYVPPKKGGKNRNWYYNKNRKLMNDSNCCFGRGMRNRYRHRWGWGWGRNQ